MLKQAWHYARLGVGSHPVGQHGGSVQAVQPDAEEGFRGPERQDERLQRVDPDEHQRGEGVRAQERAAERGQRAGSVSD